jgi:hypothetical protein
MVERKSRSARDLDTQGMAHCEFTGLALHLLCPRLGAGEAKNLEMNNR